MSDYTKITSVEQLKSICTEETQEFFIWLGIARSSKSIAFDEDMNKFYIHNEIDDTEQFKLQTSFSQKATSEML